MTMPMPDLARGSLPVARLLGDAQKARLNSLLFQRPTMMGSNVQKKYNANATLYLPLPRPSFRSKARDIDHFARCHDMLKVSEHECELCGKSFTKKFGLQDHMLRHENRRTFFCPICPCRFNTRGDLRSHFKRFHGGVVDKKGWFWGAWHVM
ncbi:hypothetical protein EV121DRAFT_291162 [Schizophyllum commune]